MLVSQSYSTTGKKHLKDGKRNQDNMAHITLNVNLKETFVGVVSDGCGSTPDSHIGSALMCQAVIGSVTSLLENQPCFENGSNVFAEDLPQRVQASVLQRLSLIVSQFYTDPQSRYEFIVRSMVATYICVIANDKHCLIFGMGDGIVLPPSGDLVVAEYKDNAPPYLAYWMIPASKIVLERGWTCNPMVFFRGDWEKEQSLVIATDGLSPFVTQQYVLEPKGLRGEEEFGNLEELLLHLRSVGSAQAVLGRQMAIRQKRSPAFKDDATLVVLHNT